MRSSTSLFLPLFVIALGACNKKSDAASDGRPTIKVSVEAAGYKPSEIKAKGGSPVRVEFTRTTDEGCGQQLVFPTLDIKKDLPLNEPVAVDVTMPASGKLAFTCGMDMYKGALVAE